MLRRRVVMIPFITIYVDALETLSNVRRGSRHLSVVVVFVIQRGRGGKIIIIVVVVVAALVTFVVNIRTVREHIHVVGSCLLYTSDAADE